MLEDMELRLGYDAVDRGIDQVREAVDTIDVTRRRAASDVSALLDGGWTGAASESFGEAWAEWLAGAAQVSAALSSIAGSLSWVRRDLTHADDDARCRLE